MGLDITIHRKDTPYGRDFYYNGRNRYRQIKDLMVEKYNYSYGKDLLLTDKMIKDLLTVVHNRIIELSNESTDVILYGQLYNDLVFVFDNMYVEDWYFEATW